MAVNDTWPWTSYTTLQGFLSNRWLRRDGNVYGTETIAPPQVLSITWVLRMPTSVGDMVGPCGAIGLVTNWAIVAGNADGYWAINSRGLVTVARLGMYEDVTYEISVTASNRGGTSAPTEMFIHTTTSGVSGTVYIKDFPIVGGEDAEESERRRRNQFGPADRGIA